jgi:hypothetical protein
MKGRGKHFGEEGRGRIHQSQSRIGTKTPRIDWENITLRKYIHGYSVLGFVSTVALSWSCPFR